MAWNLAYAQQTKPRQLNGKVYSLSPTGEKKPEPKLIVIMEQTGKSDTTKLDFGRYIQDWAVQYGFSAQQAKEKIDKWIADVEVRSNDLNRLGLAAFAKKNFAEAAKNFEAAFAQDSTHPWRPPKSSAKLWKKERIIFMAGDLGKHFLTANQR